MADKGPQKLFARLYIRAEGIKSQKKSNKHHKWLKRIVGDILRHSTGDTVFGVSLSDNNNEEIDFNWIWAKYRVVFLTGPPLLMHG